MSNREPDPDRAFNYDIFAVRVDDRTVRRVTDTPSAEYQPRWSPDGRTIAYLGTRRSLTSSETTMEDTHVWAVDADGSNRREMGDGVDNRQRNVRWAADGRSLYFTVQARGNVHLFRLPVSGGSPEDARDRSRARRSLVGRGRWRGRLRVHATRRADRVCICVPGRRHAR